MIFIRSIEDDFRRAEEHVAEARRLVQRQKGPMIRLRAAGANTCEAQRILWLLESILRRFGERRDRLRANVAKCWLGRLIGSDETVRNPSLGSDREPPHCAPREVAVADQMASWHVDRFGNRRLSCESRLGPVK